jgi:type II secretory pathway pseudopilin PulG
VTGKPFKAGFTLLEAALSIGLLSGLLYVFFQSLAGFDRLGRHSKALHAASADASRAMGVIRRDLERSGHLLLAGQNFPQVFPAGEAPAGFSMFEHAGPNSISGLSKTSSVNPLPAPTGGVGLPGFSPEELPESREALYVLPADADSDGWPDLNAGEPVWSPNRLALQLIPVAAGDNHLVRRSEAGTLNILARGVRAFRVDLPVDTGYTIPLDSVRVWIQLVRESERGGVQLFNRVDVIQLRNGGLAP